MYRLYELFYNNAISSSLSDPKFKEPIANVTAPVGREAILSCVVQDLAGYKVSRVFMNTYKPWSILQSTLLCNVPIELATISLYLTNFSKNHFSFFTPFLINIK